MGEGKGGLEGAGGGGAQGPSWLSGPEGPELRVNEQSWWKREAVQTARVLTEEDTRNVGGRGVPMRVDNEGQSSRPWRCAHTEPGAGCSTRVECREC